MAKVKVRRADVEAFFKEYEALAKKYDLYFAGFEHEGAWLSKLSADVEEGDDVDEYLAENTKLLWPAPAFFEVVD